MPRSQRSTAPQSVFPVARTSTVDLIAIELRNAIFSGALTVGSQIREIDMAAQLGVSRSPLREAMQRLVQERLLTAIPGRGLRVSFIDAGHVPDLYCARAAVEVEAIQVLAKDPQPEALRQLEDAYRVLISASEFEDPWAIADADIGFHQRLVNLAGSRRLSQYMATLAIETRIAIFSLPEGFAVPRAVSPTYRTLLDALADGEAATAEVALREQFEEAIGRFTGEEEIPTLEAPDEEPPVVEPIRG